MKMLCSITSPIIGHYHHSITIMAPSLTQQELSRRTEIAKGQNCNNHKSMSPAWGIRNDAYAIQKANCAVTDTSETSDTHRHKLVPWALTCNACLLPIPSHHSSSHHCVYRPAPRASAEVAGSVLWFYMKAPLVDYRNAPSIDFYSSLSQCATL